LTRPVAGRIATNSIDAIAALALRSAHTSRTIGRFASTHAVAFGRALVVRIRIGNDIGTHSVRGTGLRSITRLARSGARVFTTHAVDAEIARAFSAARTGSAIRKFRTTANAIADGRANAFIVRIRIARNGRTGSIGLSSLRVAARFARTDTSVFATHEVDACLAETFVVRRARLPVRIDALARTIADLKAETRRRIVSLLCRHVRAGPSATRHCTRFTFARAAAVATHAIDAEAERTLVIATARSAQAEFYGAKVRDQVAIIAARALSVVGAIWRALPRVTQECSATRIAAIDTYACTVARIDIDERITDTRCTLTNRAHRIVGTSAGAITRTSFAARTGGFLIAFVLRILAGDDGSALTIEAAAF